MTPVPAAQESPTESPTQAWISNWVDYLEGILPLVFLVVVLVVGIILIARTSTGIGKMIGFGIGAALLFLLVTNVELVSQFLTEELPIAQTGDAQD
jgi:ABC-type bacteriocin/lantibiotic exporter with double-glycine peptidase domain